MRGNDPDFSVSLGKRNLPEQVEKKLWEYLGRVPSVPEWPGLLSIALGSPQIWWGHKEPFHDPVWDNSQGAPFECSWLELGGPIPVSGPIPGHPGLFGWFLQVGPCRFALIIKGSVPPSKPIRDEVSRMLEAHGQSIATRRIMFLVDFMFEPIMETMSSPEEINPKRGTWQLLLDTILALRAEKGGKIWINIENRQFMIAQSREWDPADWNTLVFPFLEGDKQLGGIAIQGPNFEGTPWAWRTVYGGLLRRRIGRLVGLYWNREARDARKILHTLLENVPVPMSAMDLSDDFKYILWNRALSAVYGIGPETVLGRRVDEIWNNDIGIGFAAKFREQVADNKPYEFPPMTLTNARGEILKVVIRVMPVTLPEATKPQYLIVTVQNVTEELHQKQLLENAKAEAEAANRAKTLFLANMSHEIRTPVGTIIGYGEMLMDPGLDDVTREEAAKALRTNGAHLLNLISNILDISKIESEMLQTEAISTDVWHLATMTVGDLMFRSAEKEVQLRIEAETPIPSVLDTDPTRLRQILLNLLGNALKFTEKGSVKLALRVEDVASDKFEDGKVLRIEVRDTGIGMSPENLKKVFTPFRQADGSVVRRFGGTGLGLSICRTLVNLLGGDLGVKSQPGVGSVFTVDLPIGGRNPGPMIHPQSDGMTPLQTSELEGIYQEKSGPPALYPGARVLLVDDNPDNLKIVSYLFRQRGMEPTIASGGVEALEKMGKTHFDLVLLDVQMPDLDGHEVARTARAFGYQNPIVAHTANVLAGEELRCIQSGCDAYLSKPIQVPRLESVLRRFLRGFSHEGVVEGSGSPVGSVDKKKNGKITSGKGKEMEDFCPEMDDPVIAGLVREYLDHLPSQLEELRTFLHAGELKKCESVAHKIKGSGGMYGFPSFTRISGEIEAACSHGKQPREILHLIEQLAHSLQLARKAYLP